ncbi:DUF2922 domain-containing protein [Anaerobacillus isosaccharinicus]|uniref:DUF2922 domain-containing protein n=1 Tax=Anaerobacillus isosaccharinicus TaxID=1532552 RepID=A0A1S2MEZ3_9BACI|nr:DUF2922 domain-containing protein [Anaerobacillus isosaccharinicus]MBA5586482.1 DUF2922 domain-containing protein [Anaerobacillus isosaccharinicus]QOY35278.1 DUF2922 domain-containing protein [Anaerobacillus isosaccharinicus]
MAKKIELIFKNEIGRNVTISLDNPIEPVDTEKVSLVMDQVIAQQAFVSSGGLLVGKAAARIVERNVEPISIPVN